MIQSELMDNQKDLFERGRDAARTSQPKFIHQAHNLKGNDEWYTPHEYVDAARKVMGSIDIDPCSNDLAQQIVQASEYYTIETNGLAHPWKGCCWLNPPYNAKDMRKFVDKLIYHYEAGDVTQCIMLTHNNVDTAWWHTLADVFSAWCVTRGRVKFYNQDGTANSPTHGHVFLYFGRRVRRFRDVFCQFGSVFGGLMR